jgi:hypothetical protein
MNNNCFENRVPMSVHSHPRLLNKKIKKNSPHHSVIIVSFFHSFLIMPHWLIFCLHVYHPQSFSPLFLKPEFFFPLHCIHSTFPSPVLCTLVCFLEFDLLDLWMVHFSCILMRAYLYFPSREVDLYCRITWCICSSTWIIIIRAYISHALFLRRVFSSVSYFLANFCLFTDAVSNSDCIASICWNMVNN